MSSKRSGVDSAAKIVERLQADVAALIQATTTAPPSSAVRRRMDAALRRLLMQVDGMLGELDPVINLDLCSIGQPGSGGPVYRSRDDRPTARATPRHQALLWVRGVRVILQWRFRGVLSGSRNRDTHLCRQSRSSYRHGQEADRARPTAFW
jgi:hypothetical protein